MLLDLDLFARMLVRLAFAEAGIAGNSRRGVDMWPVTVVLWEQHRLQQLSWLAVPHTHKRGRSTRVLFVLQLMCCVGVADVCSLLGLELPGARLAACCCSVILQRLCCCSRAQLFWERGLGGGDAREKQGVTSTVLSSRC